MIKYNNSLVTLTHETKPDQKLDQNIINQTFVDFKNRKPQNKHLN